MDRRLGRMAIAMTVLALHAAALENVLRNGSRQLPRSVEEIPAAEAEIIESGEEPYKVPAADLQFITVPVEFPGILQVELDDSVQDELGEVVSPISAPHVARVQSVDLATFARRLKLPPGVALTILLRVQVTEDGWVDSADVIRTSGNEAADAAAIDYAQELRWVPGTINHSPKTQRVMFSVTLTSSEAPPSTPCDPRTYRLDAQTCDRHTL